MFRSEAAGILGDGRPERSRSHAALVAVFPPHPCCKELKKQEDEADHPGRPHVRPGVRRSGLEPPFVMPLLALVADRNTLLAGAKRSAPSAHTITVARVRPSAPTPR